MALRSWQLTTLVIALSSGCSFKPLTYECTASAQCGANGICLDGACAFPSASCSSGYQFDSTAKGLGGQCTDAANLDLSRGSATDLSMVTVTPCKMFSSYDHYCSDQGYPPHFNQCIGNETPASGCENVLLTGVSCGQGGAGGTIRDCFCCP